VRIWWRFAGLLLILAVGVAACSGPGQAAARGINEGNLAHDFTLVTLDGTQVSLADYHGQVVLINFWATWCPPCRAEIPEIEEVYRARKEDGFVVLGINAQEPVRTVEPFVDTFDMSYPVLLDEAGEVIKTYRASGLPMSIVVDQEGVIQKRHVGFLSGAMLRHYLADLLP